MEEIADLDIKYILKNQYIINNKDGYIRLIDTFSEEKDICYLSVLYSYVISLFDGYHNKKDIIFHICELLNIQKDKSEKIFYRILNIFKSFIKKADENEKRDDINFKKIIIGSNNPPLKNLSDFVNQKRQRKFEILVIFVSNKCSSNCIYCSVDAGHKNEIINSPITIDEYRYIAKQAKEIGINTIVITGGDPFVHKDIINIIKIFVKRGFSIELSTKEIIKLDTIIKLKEVGLNKLQFSLDTCDPEIFSTLIGLNKNVLPRLLNCMKMVIDNGIELEVKCVITKINLYSIPNMICTLFNLGCKKIKLQEYFRGQGRYSKSLFATDDDLLWLYSEIKEIEKKYPLIKIENGIDLISLEASEDFKLSMRQTCGAGRIGMAIHADGQYGFCGMTTLNEFKFSNIREMTLKDAWNSEYMKKFIDPSPDLYIGTMCENCEKMNICNIFRCHLRTLINQGKIFDKDPKCPVYL